MFTIRQTPCFIDDGGILKNELLVTSSEALSCPASLTMDGAVIWSGTAKADQEFAVYIPEIASLGEHRFTLGGCEITVSLRPQRKWEVHLVQFSHHDPGYTDTASHVLWESAEQLREALDHLDARADYPEEARPRIVVEQAYSLYEFFRRSDPDDRGRMLRHIQAGNVEVTAFWANLISELLSPEECLRAMYPAKAVEDMTGVPIVTAEHNDITGFTWGYATALCRAGVKYFMPNLPLYYSWGYEGYESFWDEEAIFGRTGPGAFWWESPEGDRIFTWCNNNGCLEETEPSLPTLTQQLTDLENSNWPHRVFRLQVRGEYKDNSKFINGYSDTAKAWNEKYAWPKLICSTEKRFCEAFLDQLTVELPVWRGGVDGQDYPVASTSQMESSSVAREDHGLFRAAEIANALTPEASDLRLGRSVENMLMADEHAYGANTPDSFMQLASWWEHGAYAPRAYYDLDQTLQASAEILAKGSRADGDVPRITVLNLSGAPGRQPVSVSGRPLDLKYLTGSLYLKDAATGEIIPCGLKKLNWDDPVLMAGARAGVGAGTKRMGLFDPPTTVGYTLEFTSPELPPYGLRTLELHQSEAAPRAEAPLQGAIQNEFYKITFDDHGLLDVEDLVEHRSLLDATCPHTLCQLLIRYANDTPVPAAVTSVTAKQDAAGETVTLRYSGEGLDHARVDVTLRPGVDNVYVAARIGKNAIPLQSLYLAFPFAGTGLRYQSVLHETAPAADVLPGSQSDTLAVQDWVHVQGSDLYWNSGNAPVVSLSHLWEGYISPAHRCIMTPPPHPALKPAQYDTGWIYSVLTCNNFGTNFYTSQLSSAVYHYTFAAARGREKYAWGAAAARPAYAVITIGPAGVETPVRELLDVPGLRVITLKRAENKNGLILRLQNDTDCDVTAPVTILGAPVTILAECDVLERDLNLLSGNAVTVKAGKLATIRITR